MAQEPGAISVGADDVCKIWLLGKLEDALIQGEYAGWILLSGSKYTEYTCLILPLLACGARRLPHIQQLQL